ncbi:MAG TPA: ABC transporter permease [Gemmatimonadales bacterium]|nr:ABC transporter permease [Gemmatimonadales bacterium]
MAGFTAFVRRLAHGALVAFAVVTVTFALLQLAPGEPLAGVAESPYASPEVIEQMRRNFGLDRPIHVQYARYVRNLLRGDWGMSFAQRRPVLDALADALPNTVVLGLAALLVNFAGGIALGSIQALRPRSALDKALSAVSLVLYSLPVFWLGLMLLLVFGQVLGWFPVGGVVDPVTHPSLSPIGQALDRLHHLALPALALGLVGAGSTARYQRAALLEVLGQDFIRTARAAGLSERTVVLRHALPAALLPTITLVGLTLPSLLSGAVLVETVFSWPGVGRLTVNAVLQRDYPMVAGAALLASIAVVAANAVADLAYRLADPRTREA